MSTMILLYCIFPLLYRVMKNEPTLLLMITLMLCWYDNKYSNLLFTWLFPFTLGIWLAQSWQMEKLISIKDIKGWLILFAFFAISLIARHRFKVKMDAFFGLSIILIVVNATYSTKYFSKVLGFIGQHSGNIFMFHSFIYAFYFSGLIYSLWYPPLIYIVLLAVCLIISVGLEKLKVMTRYNKLQNLLLMNTR